MEEEKALIFEKCYRGKYRRSKVDSAGMGLPIARAIVEAHGGTITVASRPGQGSIFTVSIPLARGTGRNRTVSQFTIMVALRPLSAGSATRAFRLWSDAL